MMGFVGKETQSSACGANTTNTTFGGPKVAFLNKTFKNVQLKWKREEAIDSIWESLNTPPNANTFLDVLTFLEGILCLHHYFKL